MKVTKLLTEKQLFFKPTQKERPKEKVFFVVLRKFFPQKKRLYQGKKVQPLIKW